VENDIAGAQQTRGSERLARAGDRPVGRGDHPHVRGPHLADGGDRPTLADESDRRLRAGRRSVGDVLHGERLLFLPQRGQRAADASGADDIERDHSKVMIPDG